MVQLCRVISGTTQTENSLGGTSWITLALYQMCVGEAGGEGPSQSGLSPSADEEPALRCFRVPSLLTDTVKPLSI